MSSPASGPIEFAAFSSSARTQNRSLSLDVLRIFATLWVLAFHLAQAYPEMFISTPVQLQQFFLAGHYGVDLFFVLSGVVIASSAVEKGASRFALARFFRLAPAYFVATILALALEFLTTKRIDPLELFAMTGLQFWTGGPYPVGPAWTLFVEASFYLLVFTGLKMRIFRIGNRFDVKKFLIYWIATSLIAHSLFPAFLDSIPLMKYLGCFSLGMTFSLIKSKADIKSNGLLLLASACLFGREIYLRLGADLSLKLKAEAFIFLLLVAFCSLYFHVRSNNDKLISPQWVTRIALMTYPLYLLHQNVAFPIADFIVDWLAVSQTSAVAVAIVLIVGICYVQVSFLDMLGKKLLASIAKQKS